MAIHITEDCTACGTCMAECPAGAIVEGDIYAITEECLECGACLDVCPVSAIIED